MSSSNSSSAMDKFAPFFNTTEIKEKLDVRDENVARRDMTVHVREIQLGEELKGIVREIHKDLKTSLADDYKDFCTTIVKEEYSLSRIEVMDGGAHVVDPSESTLEDYIPDGPPSSWMVQYIAGWFLNERLNSNNSDINQDRIENLWWRNSTPTSLYNNITARALYSSLQLHRFMMAKDEIMVSIQVKAMMEDPKAREMIIEKVMEHKNCSREQAEVDAWARADLSRIDVLSYPQDNYLLFLALTSLPVMEEIFKDFPNLLKDKIESVKTPMTDEERAVNDLINGLNEADFGV